MDGEPELLDSGRPDEEGALRRFRRAHPRVVVGALVVAALAGAGWVAARALSGPDLRVLAVAEVLVLDPYAEPEPEPELRGAGSAGAVLDRVVSFRVAAPGLEVGAEPWQVAVLGLAGPGIVDATRAAQRLPLPLDPGGSITRARTVAVNCGAVRLPVDASAYGLRVAVGAGGSATGVLPLGRAGKPWAEAVGADCARAEAARTVRVLSVAGEVDPTRPLVDLRFLVENEGPYVVEVVPEVDYSAELVRAVELAPGARQQVPVRMALDPCPAFDPQWGEEGAWSWPVGLTAAVAGVLPKEREERQLFGPPRLDLDAAAAQTLRGLLSEACAGLPPMEVDAPAQGVRFDPEDMLIEAAVVVTPPADFLGRLSVGPVDELEWDPDLEPLWAPTAMTAPGDTEPVAVSVRYKIQSGRAFCDASGLYVPLDVQVRVPSGAAERTARLRADAQIPWPPGVPFDELALVGC